MNKALPPHPATVVQRRSMSFGVQGHLPPHPATVIQRTEIDEDGFVTVSKKKKPVEPDRDVVWADDDLVSQAQEVINDWHESMVKAFKQDGPIKKIKDRELVICIWVYYEDKKIRSVVETNENRGNAYKSKTDGKKTVCAEDILAGKYARIASRTLYSLAFNLTQGMSWPACTTNGGCKKLLRDLGIVEPPYAGLERDMGRVRKFDRI